VSDVGLRQQLRDALAAVESLRAANQQLEARNAELVTRNEELAARVAVLADRLSLREEEAGRDSESSSKPPSTDNIATRQTRAQRRAAARQAKAEAKRKPGKQPGSAGCDRARVEPQDTVEHRPLSCGGCGKGLDAAAVCGQVTRQVIDLPEITPRVVDHVAYRCRCSCGVETLADFPPAARAAVCYGPGVRALAIYLLDRQHLPYERCAELLGEVLGVTVSTGWLCAIQHEADRLLVPFVEKLKLMLADAAVLHVDETGTAVGLDKHWVHTVTDGLVTLLEVHPERGRKALEDIGVLGAYAGVLVHDGYASYDYLEAAAHAQCHAHLLRHLKDVARTDAYKAWTQQMIGVLLDAKHASEAAAAVGRDRVAKTTAARIRVRYHACLDQAFASLPPGPKPRLRHQGGWSIYQRKAWNLATRMRRDAADILRLLDDCAIPADNNAAERSFRMVKIHDKVSGTFHSLDVAKAFAHIRSYIQTAANNGLNRLDVLRQLFTDGPWIPPPHPAET
jgi:transposase